MASNGFQDPRLGFTSASNAESDALCQGRYKAQLYARDLLEIRPRPDADFGTNIHRALSVQSTTGLTDDELKVYELCQSVEQGILERYFGMSSAEAQQKCWRHHRLWHEFGGFKHSCELDVGYRLGSRALLIEYKTLFGEVPVPSENKQLRDQAVLFWKNFFLIDEIAVAVDQPHITLKPQICVYKVPDLQRAETEITERIIRSHASDPKRTAGELQCGFCDAKTFCKEYELWAASNLPMGETLWDTPMASWGPEQWVSFCTNMGTAERWLNLGKAEAKERLKKDPESIPGFYLKPGHVRRAVVKVNELYGRFEKLGGKIEDFHRCIEVVLGRLEEEIRKATGAKGKGLDKAMDAILSGLIEEKETEPSIAKKKE